MFISLVIPVYNRPQEVRELLESLTHQTRRDFETVVVEDGSAPELSSDGVVREYADRLDICYVRQPNGGPAAARNTGAAHAHGDFLVIMDSDCIVPPGYFETVYAEVEARGIAFYGGPDMAAPDFSPLQKAVSYSMTSVFTTGGIRGNRRSIGKFSPRSFNLGISRPLFEQVGGFSDMRIGEDIDFSMRVMAAGAQAWFLPDAKVCHKRRTSIRLFFKQVFVFGTARVNLDIRHPESRRALFMLPSLFTIGSAALLLAALCTSPWFLLAVVGVAALWALGTPVQWGGLLLVLFGAVYAPWWFSLPFGALMLLWFADAEPAPVRILPRRVQDVIGERHERSPFHEIGISRFYSVNIFPFIVHKPVIIINLPQFYLLRHAMYGHYQDTHNPAKRQAPAGMTKG